MRVRWAEHVACMEDTRNAYTILVRKFERSKLLGRPMRRMKLNIKIDLKGVGSEGVD
jgi:hypothetical protein